MMTIVSYLYNPGMIGSDCGVVCDVCERSFAMQASGAVAYTSTAYIPQAAGEHKFVVRWRDVRLTIRCCAYFGQRLLDF